MKTITNEKEYRGICQQMNIINLLLCTPDGNRTHIFGLGNQRSIR